MSSLCHKIAACVLASVGGLVAATAEDCCGDLANGILPSAERNPHVLRITADPNNLPFSNDKLEGFENKVAELIATELGMKIEWTWRAQRRGFFRETLKASTADLILGAPAGYERALTTKPYYRSAYAFVSRKDRGLTVRSFDDPQLRDLKIGVQLVGDDGMNTPPAHALAQRGIVDNLIGFTLYGDYAQPNPPARIVDAVASGAVDLAVVWGPLAGYFAQASEVPLVVTPVENLQDASGLKFAFSIAMGVRKRDKELKELVDAVLVKRKTEIDAILGKFGVPLLPMQGKPSGEESARPGEMRDELNVERVPTPSAVSPS